MMLADAQSYVRVQNIYNVDNFDPSLREAATFIKEHSDKYKTMPELEQLNAAVGTKLKPIPPEMKDGHYDWFMDEFEKFTKRQELERAILKSADMLEKGNFEQTALEKFKKELSKIETEGKKMKKKLKDIDKKTAKKKTTAKKTAKKAAKKTSKKK